MTATEINKQVSDFAAFCLGESMRFKITCYDYRMFEDYRAAIIELQSWNRASILDYLADKGFDSIFPNLWNFSRDQALGLLLEHLSDAGPYSFIDTLREGA